MNKKKIIYIDMDNTLVDYSGHAKELNINPNDAKHVPNFFRELKPISGAIDAYNLLNEYFDVYILTTAPWNNPSAWSDKLLWIQKYFGDELKKKLIISHHKDLLIGDYLIDDSPKNGAADFHGEWLHFLEGEQDERGYATIDWKAT